jgi:hypothetical protein
MSAHWLQEVLCRKLTDLTTHGLAYCVCWKRFVPSEPSAGEQPERGIAMTFEEVLDQAIAMLQRRGRLTYRTLKRQFHLDETWS